MNDKKTKTIGILGGMGPYATVSFYQNILNNTSAKKDWDHLHVVIDSNPHIPSRSRHYLYGETSPVFGMIDSCRRLETYPVDFIVIPCNSAAFYLPEVQKHINIPILNIMEITVNALTGRFTSGCSFAVFGGIITYDQQTYKPFLQKNGFSYFHHSLAIQRGVENLIEKIKINDPQDEITNDFNAFVHSVCCEHPVSGVILGCTEFDLISNSNWGIPIINSSRELALYTIKHSLR